MQLPLNQSRIASSIESVHFVRLPQARPLKYVYQWAIKVWFFPTLLDDLLISCRIPIWFGTFMLLMVYNYQTIWNVIGGMR